MLEILFEDDHIIAINKPHGLLVHKSPIARNADTFAIQELRNQIDQRVHPVHRLDRKTSGVLLFTKNQELIAPLQKQFSEKMVEKKYRAILRGYTDDEGLIDYPLTNDKGKVQKAQTAYITLAKTEVNVPFGKFNTSRYSLVEATPKTGRMHQLRKHFAHILHPIIGDRPHGCNKQNKLFLEKWQMSKMMLHAKSLQIVHPINGQKITIEADVSSEFKRTLEFLEFNYLL